ncbi:hypothetical protein BC826DRAFT_121773 [Russula brevipes]|nr:hypothetical protein BC826DRAFT_121773 [Russula brevipes]
MHVFSFISISATLGAGSTLGIYCVHHRSSVVCLPIRHVCICLSEYKPKQGYIKNENSYTPSNIPRGQVRCVFEPPTPMSSLVSVDIHCRHVCSMFTCSHSNIGHTTHDV